MVSQRTSGRPGQRVRARVMPFGFRSSRRNLLLSAAAFVIIVAGMRAAAGILVPFFLAVFIAVLCSAPLGWLQRIGVPRPIGVALVVLGLLGVGSMVTTLVGSSVIDFTRSIPFYQRRLQSEAQALLIWLEGRGIDVAEDFFLSYFDVGRVLQLAGGILTGVRAMLTNGILILLTMIFILVEMASFPVKLRAALGESSATFAYGTFARFAEDARRYIGIKTLISLATGALVAVWLGLLGVEYSLLWGLLAFLLNYVPTIGSFIAAIPAVLFAFLQLGPGSSLLAVLGYLVINTLLANVIEPRVMGRSMGLSTLVVFLSLVFWGWVLGPIGMLLSVPLTVILKLALEGQERTRWMAVLLGPAVPDEDTPPTEEMPAVG